MMYVWDTDTTIYWLKGNQNIKDKSLQVGIEKIYITLITLLELKYGAYKSQKVEQNLINIENLLRKISVLNLNEKVAEIYGQIKANLERKGHSKDDFDILIASISLYNNAVLVTNNMQHFQKISELTGLKLENWIQ